MDVILLAGGLGTRFKSKVPKPFVLLKGKPLITYSLNLFEKNKAVSGIIIVGTVHDGERLKRLSRPFKKVTAIVNGGKTRAESVKCGLAVVKHNTQHVLVHDAARPFADDDMIKDLLHALEKYSAAIIAVPVKDTIKQGNLFSKTVEKSLNRSTLWSVQTPQAFHREILIKAHAQPYQGEVTDDAMLVEQLGVEVKIVEGKYRNIKITTPEDLIFAKSLV